ncbi:hypothetical protein [Streptomyces fulvoviolaceus]|uniref:hypothetical protein n=1 Tax=Streptomyces fulvoviolaceus TaxID=285535 RepID=UPI0021C001D0|nr:hypothetical protein [Streptomyces fulvoviolaceus]MCT9083880.1 hypothetical protein [Streptomyces fulvoviolaceus]
MDLLDWHRETLSARRLALLVKHLPRDSALNRELHGEAAEWSVSDHLLAAAVDHLAAANWMFACVNSEEGDQPEPPTPVPRPSYDDEGEAPPTTEPSPSPDPGSTPNDEAPSAVQLARFFG